MVQLAISRRNRTDEVKGTVESQFQQIPTDAAPLVSVILPAYNREAFIGPTLESVLSQTYRNIEVIVVDDGSTDRTLHTVEAYAARDSRIRVVPQANTGVAGARNRGLAEAQGEFVAPIDADDLWEPLKIERQVQRMQEIGDTAGMIYCWWVWIDEIGAILDRSPAWAVEGDVLEALIQVNFTGNASVPLFRRKCVQEVGGYEEDLERKGGRGCEDWDLALKIAERYKVGVVPELLVGYRRLPDSMSAQCEVMWKSQTLLADSLHEREPDLDPMLLRRSADQFALYIAGVFFRSGSYIQAVRWALRARHSGLLYRVLPYVIRIFARRLFSAKAAEAQVMVPGQTLTAAAISEPLVPYDRIYASRGGTFQKPVEHEFAAKEPGNSDSIRAFLRSLRAQALVLMAAFSIVAAMNARNDGLWFQGDSPRHAANGFFWWDLIATRPEAPVDFAVRYYARYPFINPVTYPPLFYLLEGLAFRIAGPSPYIARDLVLAFAVMTGFYVMAWARRWIAPEAGWAGTMLAFLPGIVQWSNAVMLNVPALAFGVACLYHWRRWLESKGKAQLTAATLLGAAALFTYYQGGIVLAIAVAFAFVSGTPGRFAWRRQYWLGALLLLGAVPLVVAARIAPMLAARHLPTLQKLNSPDTWTFYPKTLPDLLGYPVLLLGIAAAAVSLCKVRWRKELRWLGLWIVGPMLAFSFFPAQDSRYILLVAPAAAILCAVGAAAVLSSIPRIAPAWFAFMLGLILGGGFWQAYRVRLPQISGFREAAEFMRSNAPSDAVFYDGYNDGLFGFYVRALDPGWKRRIVLGQEILYHDGPAATFDWVDTSKANTAQEVVNLLRTRAGCRWIAIEIGSHSEWAKGQKLLREAVAGPDFELVRSFPVTSPVASRIDLYRMLGPIVPLNTIDLVLASYSDRTFLHVLPITR